MATFTNGTKNTDTFTNGTKSGAVLTKQLLEIGEGYNLLIDSTYKLEIQPACSSCSWTNGTKN